MAERTTREHWLKVELFGMVANRLSFDEKPCSVMGVEGGMAICSLAAACAAITANWALSGAYAKTALHCDDSLQRWVRGNLLEQRYLTP